LESLAGESRISDFMSLLLVNMMSVVGEHPEILNYHRLSLMTRAQRTARKAQAQ
jgi:hypothetical protein